MESLGAEGTDPSLALSPAAAALRDAIQGPSGASITSKNKRGSASGGAGPQPNAFLRVGRSLRRGSTTGVSIQGSGFSFSMVEPLKVGLLVDSYDLKCT